MRVPLHVTQCQARRSKGRVIRRLDSGSLRGDLGRLCPRETPTEGDRKRGAAGSRRALCPQNPANKGKEGKPPTGQWHSVPLKRQT
jgi:hypothetical protein